jgi:hypothetical protein
MTTPEATLQDVWRLLGGMNRRMNERFDVIERQMVALDTRVAAVEAHISGVEARVSGVEAGIGAKIGALKESIEARDFRLDDHGRRLTKLEESLP